ncbi:hypothetical protein ACEPPN_001237 [Leptodophora sp. 'Broadleaf-Isolate-01']
MSSLVDAREASAHEPEVERPGTGQPRNIGRTTPDINSSSPEMRTIHGNQVSSPGWFENPTDDNDAWHVSRTRWESEARLAEQNFTQTGLLDPGYVGRIIKRYINPEQIHERSLGSEENTSTY